MDGKAFSSTELVTIVREDGNWYVALPESMKFQLDTIMEPANKTRAVALGFLGFSSLCILRAQCVIAS